MLIWINDELSVLHSTHHFKSEQLLFLCMCIICISFNLKSIKLKLVKCIYLDQIDLKNSVSTQFLYDVSLLVIFDGYLKLGFP